MLLPVTFMTLPRSPTLSTMRIVPSRAVVFFLESWRCLAAIRIVMVLRRRKLLARRSIVVQMAILLTAYPAPCVATTSPHMKLVLEIHAAREDIVTCRILQAPSLTPRTLLRII